MGLDRRLRPDRTAALLGVAFVAGLLAHAADQVNSFRAGPVPILLTAPAVATLSYLRLRAATGWRTLALLGWGAVASGLGVLAVYVVTVSYHLPRAMSEAEMLLFDLCLFLWFVLALAAAYAVAARCQRRVALAVFLAAPGAQAAFAVLFVLLVESGLYG